MFIAPTKKSRCRSARSDMSHRAPKGAPNFVATLAINMLLLRSKEQSSKTQRTNQQNTKIRAAKHKEQSSKHKEQSSKHKEQNGKRKDQIYS